jgi:hypothetical protein
VGNYKTQCSTKINLGPSLFLLYMNNLSKTINGKPTTVFFAEYMSIILTNSNFKYFKPTREIGFES